jgi:hypothetical protein
MGAGRAAANARTSQSDSQGTLPAADNSCANRAIFPRIETFTALLDLRRSWTDLTLNFCPLLPGAFHSNCLRAIAGFSIGRDADRSRDRRSKTYPD